MLKPSKYVLFSQSKVCLTSTFHVPFIYQQHLYSTHIEQKLVVALLGDCGKYRLPATAAISVAVMPALGRWNGIVGIHLYKGL